MMKARRSVLLALLILLMFVCSCTKKISTLNLLVWEGYADASFIKAFEEQHHCKVSASYMGSSDELVAKLRGGSSGNYDVISPSSDVATSIAAAGLAAPLDLSKIPSYGQLSSQLTSLPLGRVKSQVWSAVHVGSRSLDLRHHGFLACARKLERALGSEISWEDFGVGRFVDHVYGGSGSR